MKDQLEKQQLKNDISKAFALINPHLYTVEERIRAQARAFDPAIEGYISYACNTKGKRIRPALVLLAGGATGTISSAHVDLAVVMELIHLASLVHDDIIDGADLRRNQPTANIKWGNSLSVLLGDVLFAHALKLATSLHDNDLSRRIAEAASDVCSGEILQTQRRFDLKLTLNDYYHIIELKTASLFAASAELGAYLCKSEPTTISALRQFGHKIGTAYQVYDDCLDIAGDERETGKSLGTDFKKGKLTLPILVALHRANSEVRNQLHDLLLNSDEAAMLEIAELTRQEGGLEEAANASVRMINEALECLDVLPESRHRAALENVAHYLLSLVKDTIDTSQ